MTRLTLLGSGTCNLLPDQAAASVLIEQDELKLVYDFGRGTATRLTEVGFKQDDIEHIFLSHFHPDHVTDLLPYLHAASWSQIDRRSKDLTIYGPVGTEALITKLLALFEHDELQRGFTVRAKDIDDGSFELQGQSLQVVDLHHARGLSCGAYAIAGDANISADLYEFLRGSELAIFDAGHLTDQEICELAVATQIPKLVCSHQYRPLNEAKLNETAQALGYQGHLLVGRDLMRL